MIARDHDTDAALDRMDQALLAVRHWARRPGPRARLRERVPVGVDLPTVQVLRAVEGAAQAPTIGEVAEALGVAPSTASRFVEQVEAKGAVERHRSDADARRALLAVTDEGRRLLGEVNRARRDVLAEATAGWPQRDRVRLAGLLERLDAGLDGLEDES